MKKLPKSRSKLIVILIGTFILTSATILRGQDELFETPCFPSGIFAGSSFSGLALKDQYISPEKYRGPLWSYNLGWARDHNKYIYRLNFEYGFSEQVKNNNARSQVTLVALRQGFLYPLKAHKLFNKELFIYLGPSADFYYYQNDPVLAIHGFEYVHSILTMFSLGFNAELIYPITNRYQLESAVSLSILSLGIRSVDDEESDESMAKLLPVFEALNGSFDLRNRFYILRKLSVSLGYRFQITNINAWDPLIHARDEITFGLNFKI
ncbi:MAG TPA: hypothetical protein P5514_13345 [Bacteroidales bacterium]|nr:hypothetical protein [Bacteroidales bacterium]HRX97927.1 hypothetical protein [Bacteroidales bacterium]